MNMSNEEQELLRKKQEIIREKMQLMKVSLKLSVIEIQLFSNLVDLTTSPPNTPHFVVFSHRKLRELR